MSGHDVLNHVNQTGLPDVAAAMSKNMDPWEAFGGRFFMVATLLFMVAFVYMLTFLCLLRFGTFVPIYDARYFRGRIYLCYGQSPCFGLLGTCTWCFVPLCLFFILSPVSEDENFNRAQEGGGLSREERREALQELLKPMTHVASRSDRHQQNTPSAEENTTALPTLLECDGETYEANNSYREEEEVVFDPMNGGSESHLESLAVVNEEEKGKTESEVGNISFEPIMNIGQGHLKSNNVLKDTTERESNQGDTMEIVNEDDDFYGSPFIVANNDTMTTKELSEDDNDDVSSSMCSLGFDPLCSICLCEYENGSIFVQPNSCSHRFHRDCLLEWLEVQNNTKCPCCREDIITNQQVRNMFRLLRKRGGRHSGILKSWFDRRGDRPADDAIESDNDASPEGVAHEILMVRTSTSSSEDSFAIAAPVPNIITRDVELGHTIPEEAPRPE